MTTSQGRNMVQLEQVLNLADSLSAAQYFLIDNDTELAHETIVYAQQRFQDEMKEWGFSEKEIREYEKEARIMAFSKGDC